MLDQEDADVQCYGCGRSYRALDIPESRQHSHHLGDSGLDRVTLLAWLDKCQAERDEWIRLAFAVEG